MSATPKILCISANPAIDRRIVLRHFRHGEVNRATSVDPAAGGKAAHVAFAAKALGAEVRWLAWLGGAEGDACRQGVEARGVTAVPVAIAGRTRTNLELIEESTNTITEVLEPGPAIREDERAAFEGKFAEEIKQRPMIVISGSLPNEIASTWYGELITRAKEAGCFVLLDASGAALRDSLSAGPDLIKPNREEAGVLLERELVSQDDAIEAARALQKRGARTVIVSLGSEGAVAAGEEFTLRATPPAVKAISTVGSGDSFMAGWAVATARGLAPQDRLRLATACGSANCLAASPGVLDSTVVTRLAAQVLIARI